MWKFSFQDQGAHKIAKKTHVERFFSIFDVKYFFYKRTVTQTFRNPVKYNWNSTRKTKKKNSLGFILQDFIPWNNKDMRNCDFGGYIGDLGTNVEFSCFFMILWISESFSLYLLVKNSFNFKLGFFTYFEYISGGIIRKNILRSDYHSAKWYWCKKDQKNLPQTSHKIFSQCLIVNSSLLWAFMVQNFCKNSFSGGKSRKNGIPVIKITFSLQKIPQNYTLL